MSGVNMNGSSMSSTNDMDWAYLVEASGQGATEPCGAMGSQVGRCARVISSKWPQSMAELAPCGVAASGLSGTSVGVFRRMAEGVVGWVAVAASGLDAESSASTSDTENMGSSRFTVG